MTKSEMVERLSEWAEALGEEGWKGLATEMMQQMSQSDLEDVVSALDLDCDDDEEEDEDDTLWSAVNTPEVGERVKDAFDDFLKEWVDDPDNIEKTEVFFEHDQWWARVRLNPDVYVDSDEETFSVVDTERDGEHAFDFEQL